jgi:FkbM family methyltransferase
MQLENFDYINKTDKKVCEDFLNFRNKRFVLGRNKWSKSIITLLEVIGVIDDFTDDKYYEGCKIYKMADIPKNAIVVSATMGGPKTAKNRLNKFNIKNIDYFAFYKYSNLKLELPPFIEDFKEDFIRNKSSYESVYNQLADEKSKEIFTDILNFKITLNLDFMKNYFNDIRAQYFEDGLYEMPLNPIFVDGGGYIGDTTMIFKDKVKNFKKVYLFEPMIRNMKLAKINLKEYFNIEFINSGISNFNGDVFFNEDDASSTISESGNIKIKVCSLDSTIKEKVDFIKLDIEGAEQDAVEGAKGLIKNSKPILAICIYHKAEDWHKIPKQILDIHKDYKIYLRHYMEGISETVMYFIPPSRILRNIH